MMKVMNAAQYAEISNELSMNAVPALLPLLKNLPNGRPVVPAMKVPIGWMLYSKKVQVASNILFLLKVVVIR